MATDMQPELAIAPSKTATIPGPGNVELVNSKESIATINGISGCGSQQGTMSDSSSRFLLVHSTKNDFDLLWSLRKYLVLLGILAVNVTYNSGLSPPGGFWNKDLDGHKAGDPVLSVEFFKRYEVFFYCNAAAFAASLVSIILLLSKSVTRQKLWLRSMQFTMIVDLFSLMGAYAAGSCRALKSSIYIWILVFTVFVYVWIHILVSTTITIVPQILKKKLKGMITHILSKVGICEGQPSTIQEIEDLEEARKFILMLVTFTATVTYQAGFGPPAGFWAENDSFPYKHRPATPILRNHYRPRYNIFISCNSTSFVASLVTIILLLSPELSAHGIRSKAVVVCVLADLLCLVGAYAAGSCRDVATSFYVMFIIVIVLICIALLLGIFVYKPVAQWLQKMKSSTVRCMSGMLSSNFGSNRSGNADHQGFHASHKKASGNVPSTSQLERVPSASADDCESQPEHVPSAPAEDNASEPKHVPCAANDSASQPEHVPSASADDSASQTEHVLSAPAEEIVSQLEHKCACNQQVSDSFNSEGNSCGECPSESTDTKDSMSSLENQYGGCKLNASTTEILSSTVHPSLSCQKHVNNRDHMSADSEHYSTDDVKTTDIQAEGVSDHNGAIKDIIVDEGPSLPVATSRNAECAEEHTSVEYSHHIDISTASNNTKHFENGHSNNDRCELNRNAHFNQTDKHMKKTRTCLLLLAILAVSLTYQSALNPPGGFWSKSVNNHLAGDRILEDNAHARFIAFFYLNAVAFVASLVMILVLLNKSVIEKVTKRRELQIAMIVVLLSLTGSFVMGSCRDAKKSIYISALLFFVLAYVAIHVLIAIHVIPKECKRVVSANLEQFWSSLPQLCYKQRQLVFPPICHKQTMNITDDKEIYQGCNLLKEMDRRRNLLLTLAILAATITYQAGMNPPGGVWSDDGSGTPGNPILQDNHPGRYDVFYYANSVSFVSSVVITILLVNKESFEHGIKSYALRVCLVVGLLGLLIAYAAGSCRNWKESIFLIIITVAVLISLVIQVLLSSMHDTLGRPLGQCMEFLPTWFFLPENVEREITSVSPEASNCEEKKKKKRHKYLMLIAILAASITYQAGLNQPGGFWSDDDKDHAAGNPILHDFNHKSGNPILRDINHKRYKIFFCFNAISFMSSVVVIMLLLSKSVRKKEVQLEVLFLIMILDLVALMTAFAAGSCRKFWTSVYVFALVTAVLTYLVIVIILSRQIEKCLRKWKRRHPELT